MNFTITTKQGATYQVNDDNAFIWIGVEKQLGYTFKKAIELISEQSLDVLTMVLYLASSLQGHTELKTRDAWVQTEFDSFDVVDDNDPKAISPEASS